ncbi:glutathionylspermidine synthase family protein [Asticcacaulis biprosthecium C19]|uniref:Glutathionylspermidine synthase family protein n=1 Tax=Asticcacaulis biprosthecium C19 TaxID=715226 RepID=F4QHX3_9CAUL|nr:glutathionylspermidine synthase family protein [Asticcacaulis biprosthecium]EGF91684.1 glutathionylspermidine synthase family protein [Asticcacaulis biprosthecium C19]
MERLTVAPRPDWQTRVEAEGMLWHTAGGSPYWNEGVCYRFSESEVEQIHDATEACHRMAMAAVATLIADGQLADYGYDAAAISLIEQSWRNAERDIYGRIDFAWDGRGAPKMLEYNADTPTSLLEAAVIQWSWLTDVYGAGQTAQYNDLHAALVDRLRQWRSDHGSFLHVSCVFPHDEDTGTVAYIESAAREAGLEVKFVPISAIGHTPQDGGLFLDQDDQPIRLLFKLYPWDWLLADDYGPRLVDAVLKGRIRLFEPAWKMLLANKRLLVKMWQMNPDSPYLLETQRTERPLRAKMERGESSGYVRKPVLGREGQNIAIFRRGEVGASEQTSGNYGDNDVVYQDLASLFVAGSGHDRVHALIGSWVIGGEAKGMGVRESASAITDDRARFVPHYFSEN